MRESFEAKFSYSYIFRRFFFPINKQKKGGIQKTPNLLSTKDLFKCSNEKAVYLVMGDTCYPKCLPFKIDEFERRLCLHYFNYINPSTRMEMKFKTSSTDPVQGNNFL